MKREVKASDITNVNDYENSIHRLGRVTGALVLLFIFLVPTLICLKYNIFPPAANVFKGILSVSIIFIPICFIEVLTYVPILGPGASYLVFVTGNLTNLKIPCATMSMEAAGVKPLTKEGDIISTISVATSALVTEVMLIICLILIVPLTPILNSPELAPAFSNILPALFGGLGAYWILKQWKLAVAPLAVTILISATLHLEVSLLIPICALVSVGAARFMYKKGWISKA